MRTPYQSRNILDECLLSSFKGSAECIRERRFLQAMKHGDPLLIAWQTTISRKGDDAAIFGSSGRIARSFRDIESHSHAFEARMDELLPGAVMAVQIGNHEDWPAVFIACLRKQLLVLPLDESVGEQQRDRFLLILHGLARRCFPVRRFFIRRFATWVMCPPCQKFGCAFLLVHHSRAPSRKAFLRNSGSRSIPSTARRNAEEFATIVVAQSSRTVLWGSRFKVSTLSLSIPRRPLAKFAFAAQQ